MRPARSFTMLALSAVADAPGARRPRRGPGATACIDRPARAGRPRVPSRWQGDRDVRRRWDRHPSGCDRRARASSVPRPRRFDPRLAVSPDGTHSGHGRRWQGRSPPGPRHREGASRPERPRRTDHLPGLLARWEGAGFREPGCVGHGLGRRDRRAGPRLARHTSSVSSVAFSPNGRLLATGSTDWTAKVWDLASGKLRHSLDGHREAVLAVAFAPDGRTLATSCRDGKARLWDVAAGTERRALLSHAGAAGPLVFLPDGRSLITGGADGSIRRWDPGDGHLEALRLHAHAGTVSALAASADGQRLASIGADGDLKNWDVAAHLVARTVRRCRGEGALPGPLARRQGPGLGLSGRGGAALGIPPAADCVPS